MSRSFVLIDLENVQPQNLHRLQGGPFEVRLFVGNQQSKVPLDMAQAMQALGPHAAYVPIDSHGRNALDFHIAFYIGHLAAENPGADFHVISKDKGFDPLISHLNGKQVSCRRWESLEAILAAPAKQMGPAVPTVDAVIGNLAKRKAARPRTVKTLCSTIKSLFENQVDDAEVQRIVSELERRGVLEVSEGKVAYHLPAGGR